MTDDQTTIMELTARVQRLDREMAELQTLHKPKRRLPRLLSRSGMAIGASLLSVLALSGAAFASIPGPGNVITGCYNSASFGARGQSALTLLDTASGNSCDAHQTAVTWNQTGPQGTSGAVGATGATGATGAMGSEGLIGLKGLTGPAGASGLIGPSGAAGLQGPSGPIGQTGPSGKNGTIGKDGIAGPPGPQGATGTSGSGGTNGLHAYTASAVFTVPTGVTHLLFEGWGAGGGGTFSADGGSGGYSRGVVTVVPGQDYLVEVGVGGQLGLTCADPSTDGSRSAVTTADGNTTLIYAGGGGRALCDGFTSGSAGHGDPSAGIARDGNPGYPGSGAAFTGGSITPIGSEGGPSNGGNGYVVLEW